MQIKTTMIYHLIPAKIAIINKSTNTGEDVEERETKYNVGGNTDWYSHLENSMEFPQKIKNGTAFWPSNSTSGNISK